MDVRKQMRQLATAAHQPGGFHVMPRVALSSKHHRFSPEKILLLWRSHTRAHTHTNSVSLVQHTILGSFLLSPSLARAISQSRFSLAYYIFTYIQSVGKWRRAQRLITLVRSCYRDQTRDFFWLWATLPPLGHLTHSFIPVSRAHTHTHTLTNSLMLAF